MGWTDLVLDRDRRKVVRYTVMNLRVPKDIEKSLTHYTTGCFLERAQF
jgi:hypothetical protein